MVHDPLADAAEIHSHYGIDLAELDQMRELHALILAVPHDRYSNFDAAEIGDRLVSGGIFMDLKSKIPPSALREDIRSWAL